MTLDPSLEESYAAFLIEAQDILKRIEQDLLSLAEDRSTNRVHRLMRSAHTLKGAAASVEIATIKEVAHVLEDIFKALYNPEIVIDVEVESLLFEGYECLRLPIMAEVTGGQIDAQNVLNRAAEVIAKLQEKLGDCFDREATLPTSVELGFDVVQSMFEVTVGQRLEELNEIVRYGSLEEVQSELWAKADMFLGLAESLDLPGFGAIAQAVLSALEAHRDQAMAIAELALADLIEGRAAVLAGDRTQGGSPSVELQALATVTPEATEEYLFVETEIDSLETFEAEVESFDLDDLFGEINNTQTSRNWKAEPQTQAAFAESSVSSSTSFSVPSDSTELPRVEPVRVDIKQLQHLDYLAGELLINQSKQSSQDQQFRSVIHEMRSALRQHRQTMYQLQDAIEQLLGQVEQERAWLPLTSLSLPNESSSRWASFSPSVAAKFDPLEMERYSTLRLLLRSALNETVQLDNISDNVDQLTKQSRQVLETQRRLMGQVRDDLTLLRMTPLRDLLNRFPRLLQQLAAAHHKPVELILNGSHVLVDKAVAEKLYDPLLHLLRNAFDHGIEPPDLRQAQGKPPVGRIEIQANQQGSQTVIEVKDDGRGIDLQRVAQRAIELNFITPEQASTTPESQLLDLLFQPGFSTATEVNDLSGRGIGLDIVNSQLHAMNGSIAISSTPQQGTTFTLKIPLSLTTIKLLVCEAQGYAYALPIEQVEQIVVPSPEQLQMLGGEQAVMHWQQGETQQAVPIYSLAELVHYADISAQLSSRANSIQSLTSPNKQANLEQPQTSPVLLLQAIYGLRALRVDRVLGEQELVIRSLGTAIAPPPYIYGCCILGNSRSALAIDVEVLMQLTTEVESLPEHALLRGFTSTLSPAALRLASQASPIESRQITGQDNLLKLSGSRTVLVVDDSLTLRHSLASLFKGEGYNVLQAEDGLKALAQLKQHPETDLVICDIEMPHLNGFEFLTQTRQDPTLAKIPVVVLTSRSSAKHRQVALTLGAVAYFTKPYERNQLLTTVDCLLQNAVTPVSF